MITAFGPANTYLLLHVLYGPKYSATDAPTALAAYCPYILLLAANGILECFVQVSPLTHPAHLKPHPCPVGGEADCTKVSEI